MDDVLRKALVLAEPDNFLRQPIAPDRPLSIRFRKRQRRPPRSSLTSSGVRMSVRGASMRGLCSPNALN